jgi:hypothetical protein
MVNQDTDIVALMDIATLVHDTEYKTKQSFGESDPQRLTQKAARIKTTIHITSRYKGESEIQDLHQKVLNVLEGETLILKENAAGLVRFEESQIRTDKDGVTRTAILIFTVLIKLK